MNIFPRDFDHTLTGFGGDQPFQCVKLPFIFNGLRIAVHPGLRLSKNKNQTNQ